MLTLLYAGNLGLGHDLDTIILAIAKMNGESNLKVIFVGEGKAKRALEKQVEQLKLDKVEFRQPVPLYRLSELMAEGDIHLVSQKVGTQGLIVPSKIYGVLAAGRPSLFIGPPDCEPAIIVKQSRSGFVISPGDVDGVISVLTKLTLDRELRIKMGEQAKSYYKEHFGRDRSISRIIQVLESIAQPQYSNWMRTSNSIVNTKRLIIAAFFTATVLVATHLPQELLPDILQLHGIDKLQHVIAYSAITLFLIISFNTSLTILSAVILFLAISTIAVTDELTQPFVNRTADSFDWLADVIGIAVSLISYFYFSSTKHRSSPNVDIWNIKAESKSPETKKNRFPQD
jgi:hypothetical protein